MQTVKTIPRQLGTLSDPERPALTFGCDDGGQHPANGSDASQVLLGHASIVTTERYTAVNDDEMRATMVTAIGD